MQSMHYIINQSINQSINHNQSINTRNVRRALRVEHKWENMIIAAIFPSLFIRNTMHNRMIVIFQLIICH